jgi:hypothetical protein
MTISPIFDPATIKVGRFLIIDKFNNVKARSEEWSEDSCSCNRVSNHLTSDENVHPNPTKQN